MKLRLRLGLGLGLSVVLWTVGCTSPQVHGLPQGQSSDLVPLPASLELRGEDSQGRGFRTGDVLKLSWPEHWRMEPMEAWLTHAGLTWSRTRPADADVLWSPSDESLGPEGYTLTVEHDRIVAEAQDAEGAFRAWTTLRQLMPAVCEQGCPQGFELPALAIQDSAYLAHRGLLLDCCRHFMAPSFVKHMIDALALQKMNVLHWHLTEDQGWRLPIEAYPKLTEVGGFRTEADGTVHGGAYTKQDIADIVAYAAERHVTVVPEVELPGHSRAALAAYPWLGCTGDTLPVPNNWGVFKDVYCAGNDSTMAFLKTVLDETCEMFPSEVIHIGGDEVPKVRWAECPKCQAKMDELGLATEAELQTHFINDIGAHLARKGRRIMGWDEILEGGLPEGAMVQSWRGMEGAVEATHLGTDAVVSPTSHCYLDYPLRSTDLEEAYSFVPVPEEAMGHAGQIVGGECNMWSEHAPQDLVMSKVFPRATGLAEVFWSGPAVTQRPGAYDAFLVRLDALSQRWGFLGVTPGLEGVPVEVDVQPDIRGQVAVTVRPAIRNAGGMVTFTPDSEGSNSETLQGRVGETLRVSGVGTLDVAVAMRGRKTGVVERFPVAGHLGAHCPVDLSYSPSVHYTGGGPQAMADGRRGSLDFRDGAWQAVQGQDMVVTVDLGALQDLEQAQVQCYLYQDAWIFLPKEVRWEVSQDGDNFDVLGRSDFDDVLAPDGRQTVVPFAIDGGGVKARFVRLTLVNAGVCPPWHDAATEPSWLFADELVVLGR